jgi:hypothetical protein
MGVLAGKPVAALQRLEQPCIEAGETDGPPPAAGRAARTKALS